ncbi:hypothetical protein [Streptomyces rubradiris]|uniref:Uncharacterized protein n=1 Tax=Streptomyces rubradiris TaxID=285531 RepID=A0ABQ3RAF9_STRRR|nr:hypothetical protein [Streptomyces rubradiris]GHH31494.1 hypothetical protein GCM10018792_79300 [Streptomyces rubradiris]GHI52849.1 hypothetical protein Srubr_26950 [Streptomyces rubradiris]GHI52862.1 hypothetical protein Srubr_27080 [Streptomyces rubradiris]
MTTIMEFHEAALYALRDRIMTTAADDDRTPQQELDGLSDRGLAAYWHGYRTAVGNGLTGYALHAAAFRAALTAPTDAAHADTKRLRQVLTQSLA